MHVFTFRSKNDLSRVARYQVVYYPTGLWNIHILFTWPLIQFFASLFASRSNLRPAGPPTRGQPLWFRTTWLIRSQLRNIPSDLANVWRDVSSTGWPRIIHLSSLFVTTLKGNRTSVLFPFDRIKEDEAWESWTFPWWNNNHRLCSSKVSPSHVQPSRTNE